MADQGEALRLTRAGQMAWERNERDGYASLFADDAVWTNADGDETYEGKEAILNYIQAVRDAWTDPVLEVTQEFGDDTQCVTVGRFRGTHPGTMPTPAGPLPATGRSVDLPLCEVVTVRDGKFQTVTWYNQAMYTMIQLGLMPAPEAATA